MAARSGLVLWFDRLRLNVRTYTCTYSSTMVVQYVLVHVYRVPRYHGIAK